jgi:hypothetical protein
MAMARPPEVFEPSSSTAEGQRLQRINRTANDRVRLTAIPRRPTFPPTDISADGLSGICGEDRLIVDPPVNQVRVRIALCRDGDR